MATDTRIVHSSMNLRYADRAADVTPSLSVNRFEYRVASGSSKMTELSFWVELDSDML